MRRHFFLGAMSLILARRSKAQGRPSLAAERAWSRPALARIGTAVVYLTLRNEGAAPLRVVGGSTPVAESVEIHESLVENNVARMHPRAEGIVVPPDGTVRFEPNGLHLMLMKPYADLKAGESFSLTLRFDNGEALTVPVTVGVREPKAEHGGMHH
ncbi:copper chaperone PCu(A)C [Pseudoroseomonas sp. WGS1072]|uniref:copper chaperone PCu(A)C n=1 Tax=Roseomonas sp. WGS1072 TaxID=3366816 RepID=UPI003BF4171B